MMLAVESGASLSLALAGIVGAVVAVSWVVVVGFGLLVTFLKGSDVDD